MTAIEDVPLFDAEDQAAAEGKVTIVCSHCGHESTGNARGRGSAAWKHGTHLKAKHGIAGTKNARRKTLEEPTEQDFAERPVISTMQSMAAAAGKRKGAPSAGDISAALGRGVAIGSMAWATYMAETDPRIPNTPEGDALRDGLAAHLALPQKAAADVVAPIGKALAPTPINTRYGRALVDNVDILASFAELGKHLIVVKHYLRDRAEAFAPSAPVLQLVPQQQAPPADAAPPAAPTQAAQQQAAPAPVPPQFLADNITPMPPAFDGTNGSPAGTGGVLATPAMVLQIQAQRAAAHAAASANRRRR